MKRRLLIEPPGLYLLLLIFNLLIGSYLWFPGFRWSQIILPVPETVLLLLLFLLPWRARMERLWSLILSLPLTVLSLFSFAEALFIHFYRRPFRLLPNLPLAANFFNMLFDTRLFENYLFLLVPSLLILTLLLLLWYLLLRGAFRWTRFLRYAGKGDMRVERKGRIPLYLAGGLLLLLLPLFLVPRPYLSERVAAQIQAEEELPNVGSYLAVRSGESLRGGESPYALAGIEDTDIHLFIVESYGMTVFTNSHQRGRLYEFYREMEAELGGAGYRLVTGGYLSTAFGGTSWLADGSLISGLRIDSQHKYDQALEGGARNLLHILAAAGYRRVLSAPGSSFMDAEHRRFYDFTRYLLYDDFAYEGPYFTYGRMPDQYQLARAAELIGLEALRKEEKETGGDESDELAPLFVEYMLCSSHVPWNYIPPYLPSWDFPNRGRVFYERRRNTYYEKSWTIGSEEYGGYAHSIRYSLESLFGYVQRYLDDGELVIIIGDHQPAYPVSERGASFAVPIHILSTEAKRVLPFLRYGYRDGIWPSFEEEFSGIERFLVHFMSIAEGTIMGRRGPGAPEGTPR